MIKIEFKDLPDTSTPYNADTFNLLQDNVENGINELASSLEFKDYTSQCTFKNCTLKSGKILKFGRLVIIQILINPTITHEWSQICIIPEELYPLAISGNGTAIIGSDFWVYTDNGIMGSITANETIAIVGIYVSKS